MSVEDGIVMLDLVLYSRENIYFLLWDLRNLALHEMGHLFIAFQ